jgi:hypothetical protein
MVWFEKSFLKKILRNEKDAYLCAPKAKEGNERVTKSS